MKPYDRTEIYDDPITKTKYEGTATLLEAEGTKCDEGEYWLVRFDKDEGGEEVYRWIYP